MTDAEADGDRQGGYATRLDALRSVAKWLVAAFGGSVRPPRARCGETVTTGALPERVGLPSSKAGPRRLTAAAAARTSFDRPSSFG